MPKKKLCTVSAKRSLDTIGFYSDFSKQNTLYAALVRSPTTTGKVKKIVLDDIPEGYYLFTANDIPGNKSFKINDKEAKIFGYNNISFSGEPLGIIVGPDESVVLDLINKVSVSFDIETLESALKNVIKQQKRPLIPLQNDKKIRKPSPDDFSSFLSEINNLPPLNTVLDKTHVEKNLPVTVASRELKTGIYKQYSLEEAEEIIFKEEDGKYISTETWCEILSDPSWQETTGTFCYFEKGKLHIYAPTKWTQLTLSALSSCLNIPIEDIFIHKTKTSGVYSKGLWRTTQIILQVATAALLTNKPIKLVLTQKEQDTYMVPGVKTNITYKTALKKDGKLFGMSVFIDIDVGSFNPFAQEIADRLTIASLNFYQPENVHIIAQAHTSKNPPSSICIKSIDSQAFFAIENQIQKLSNQANLFPDEIRLANKKSTTKFPIEIPSDVAYKTLQSTIEISDFNRKYASFNMDAIDRLQKNSNPFFALPLRGIGIASAYNISDFYGTSTFSYDPKVEVTLSAKEKVIIHSIKPSEVIQDIWKDTVSSILQIKKENVVIDSDFDVKDIPHSPEDTFSTIGTLNELIKRCCNDIQRKRFHQPLPITSKKGLTTTAKKNWNREDFSGTPFSNLSYATCAVEVELDTYTYSEKIKGIWITIDCGEIFDEAAATRTIRLEIQQELSMLVQEKSVPCDNITIKFIKNSNKSGQISALVHNTLPAAFSSALSLALATQLTKLPCTEKQLFELIQDRETAITNTENKSELPQVPSSGEN